MARLTNFLYLSRLIAIVVFAFSPAILADDKPVTVGCWNVENLFDWKKNELTPDEMLVTESQARVKLRKRAEIIKKIDSDILGLLEVENREMLRLLCDEYLEGAGYRYHVLIEETNPRGIDVGIIARRPFAAYSFAVPGFDRGLLACRFADAGKPFYVIVCHWKSRLGGGEAQRLNCARTVLKIVERWIPEMEGRKVPVIVVGDLNDESKDASVQHLLTNGFTDTFDSTLESKDRWTIMHHNREKGAVVYEGFDHVLLSQPTGAGSLEWLDSKVLNLPMMFTKRTIEGKSYAWPDRDLGDHVGYSDHRPVVGKFRMTP